MKQRKHQTCVFIEQLEDRLVMSVAAGQEGYEGQPGNQSSSINNNNNNNNENNNNDKKGTPKGLKGYEGKPGNQGG